MCKWKNLLIFRVKNSTRVKECSKYASIYKRCNIIACSRFSIENENNGDSRWPKSTKFIWIHLPISRTLQFAPILWRRSPHSFICIFKLHSTLVTLVEETEQVTWQTLCSEFSHQNWDPRNFALLRTKFGMWYILVPGSFTIFFYLYIFCFRSLMPWYIYVFFGIWVIYIFWCQNCYLHIIWCEKLNLVYLLLSVGFVRKIFYLTW